MWHISLKTIEKESVNEMIVAIAKIDSIYEHSTFHLPNQLPTPGPWRSNPAVRGHFHEIESSLFACLILLAHLRHV